MRKLSKKVLAVIIAACAAAVLCPAIALACYPAANPWQPQQQQQCEPCTPQCEPGTPGWPQCEPCDPWWNPCTPCEPCEPWCPPVKTKYELSFDTNGGIPAYIESQWLYAGETIDASCLPFKYGYTAEWGNMPADGKMPAADLQLKAEYTPIDFAIYYAIDGVGAPELRGSYNIESGTVTLASADGLRPGYTVNAWYDNACMQGEPVTSFTVNPCCLCDKWFWGCWEPIVYSIAYDANGGTIAEVGYPESYTIEDAVVLPTQVVRDGYNFNGWKDAETGEIVAEIPEGTMGDKEFIAQWEAIEYVITYMDGEEAIEGLEPASYTIEDDVTLPTPVKEGFDFLGWFDNPEFTGEAITAIAKGSTGDKVFYAQWKEVAQDDPQPAPEKKADTPKTGDMAGLFAGAALLALVGGAAGAVALRRKND